MTPPNGTLQLHPRITVRRRNAANCKRCGDPPGMALCPKCLDQIATKLIRQFDPLYKRNGASRS